MEITVELVRDLVAAQFPHWAHLPVVPVVPGGTDNRTFRLGEHLSARLPSGPGYAPQVLVEQRWLPVLAPHLPLAVPRPVALGAPGCGYPHPWSVRRWIPGGPVTAGLPGLARDLAAFLAALQGVEAAGGPAPGPHNGFRGDHPGRYDAETRACAAALADRIDAPAALAVREAGLATRRDGPPVWFHGDVAAGNLLARGGRLAAVLDLGCTGVGDPACDLVVAWTLLAPAGRDEFRAVLDPDEGTWARGRAWASWKGLLTLRDHPDGHPNDVRPAAEVVEQLLA